MDNDFDDPGKWLLQEITRITEKLNVPENHIPTLLGVIATLCQHIPDMETARKIRGDMDAMIYGAIFLFNSYNDVSSDKAH